ncbi:MAG: hypothetical protein ACI8UR_001943 [Natronomonas sp.]|jgi:hypothetical protein|uniref:hypothetical protein n=1 Tax=Natronomonas sp. TaxID=2184060 RepID=UPI00398908E3
MSGSVLAALQIGTFPLHGFEGETARTLDFRLSVAMLSGLLATVAMTVVMRLQSYGYVPPYVAAGALWGQSPSDISRTAANAVHFAAGMLAGILFEALVYGAERVREVAGFHAELLIANVTSVAQLLAAAVLVVFLYCFFSWVVFPRFGGSAYETRPETVRRQWAVSAVTYGIAFIAVLELVYSVLPA